MGASLHLLHEMIEAHPPAMNLTLTPTLTLPKVNADGTTLTLTPTLTLTLHLTQPCLNPRS